MPSLINASHFHVDNATHNILMYRGCLNRHAAAPTHFAQALEPSMWQDNFDPFAYVITDTQTHDVLLIRDHLGVQPLYYGYQSGKLVFGETIPDVLQHLDSRPSLNDDELVRLFLFNSVYSDETFQKGVFRIEPGHMVRIKPDGSIHKKPFWQLEPEGDRLIYKHDSDYVEHFSALMNESVRIATADHENIAAEFSGGIDSAAIYCTAASHGIRPTLFTHAPLPGSPAATYNDISEKALLAHYQIQNIHYTRADNFNPLEVFRQYAQWFAGPAPHTFYMFAQNLHSAVAQGKHPILLSGFGGDQCVSSHQPHRLIIPQLMKEKKYSAAWDALGPPLRPSRQPIQFMRRMRRFVQHLLPAKHNNPLETEWSYLQGPLCHEVRMRIEYSSVVSKKFGFEYRYPLLYPKLLEFFLRLPLEQKRRGSITRYLMRRYMAQFLPADIFGSYQKKEGLHIFPATMELFKLNYRRGHYAADFKGLPYENLLRHNSEHHKLIQLVHAYMLTAYAS
jgi:asparagine synthetase B (glutamine-hydrolysing)